MSLASSLTCSFSCLPVGSVFRMGKKQVFSVSVCTSTVLLVVLQHLFVHKHSKCNHEIVCDDGATTEHIGGKLSCPSVFQERITEHGSLCGHATW